MALKGAKNIFEKCWSEIWHVKIPDALPTVPEH